MNMNAKLPAHTIVDPDIWERGPVFRHFIDDLRCVMSMTVDLDVTRLLDNVHQQGLSLYSTMIWMVTKILNAHPEFRYGWDDQGRLILWDRIEPYYADFHPDRKSFVKLVTPFTAGFWRTEIGMPLWTTSIRSECRPTPLTCPVCPGSGTAVSICIFSTAALTWGRWSPGESTSPPESGS